MCLKEQLHAMIPKNHNRPVVNHKENVDKPPTIPVLVQIVSPKANKRSSILSGIARVRSPHPLCPRPRLRRTKSLPADFKKLKGSGKSLFWFRPKPDRLLSTFEKMSLVEKTESLQHRRSNSECVVRKPPKPAANPSRAVVRKQKEEELNLPSLLFENELFHILKRPRMIRDEECTTEYSEDEEEEGDDVDHLHGLSLLEERDE